MTACWLCFVDALSDTVNVAVSACSGTTYWIDFSSFSSVDGGVSAAGSCGNRRSADYSGLSFAEMWEYPVNPADVDSVTAAERMAYPPSDWRLNAVNCTTIEYERTLSWAVWWRLCLLILTVSGSAELLRK